MLFKNSGLILSFLLLVNNATSGVLQFVTTDQTCYSPGDTIRFSLLLTENNLNGDLHIVYRHLFDKIDSLTISTDSDSMNWVWLPPEDDYKGYLTEIELKVDTLVVDQISIAVDISSQWDRFPRYGFLSEYPLMTIEEQEDVINNLTRYHINGLQFYDWQWKHHQPLSGTVENPAYSWYDIAMRTNYRDTIIRYISLAHSKNINAMAYNLIYGSYEDAVNEGVQEEWRLFQDTAHQYPDYHDLPDTWASDIYLMNPENTNWQNYIINQMNLTFQAFEFDGWHVDQLGDRGLRYDSDGNLIILSDSFDDFLGSIEADLNNLLVFNAVDQYAQAQIATGPVNFCYTEVWSQTTYSELASVITTNNFYSNNQLKSVLAAYVNKDISSSPGYMNTPAVLLVNATIFATGGAHLELGEHYLSNEYFPNNNLAMTNDLESRLISYYDFLVAYENILRDPILSVPFGIISQSDIEINKIAMLDKVWVFNRQIENLQIYHFINFYGVSTMDWRDPDGTQTVPESIRNLPFVLKIDSTLTLSRAWVASPDTNQCLPIQMDFVQNNDSLFLSLPLLEYWTMLVLDFNPILSIDETVRDETIALPAQFRLGKNFPNPFNGQTRIPFEIIKSGHYTIQITNLTGQTVFSSNSFYSPDHYYLNFNANKFASGIYLYSLSNESEKRFRKMLIIK
ncbi:MAG: T9SS type A sorting domain-containing protein [Planctomycetia bacterium]|nr:T9SS type A sorting domain-containing protein [Planctomycetia bacterium]